MKTALVSGTFDPITKGHLDVISRAARMFDTVVVAVMNNLEKGSRFSQTTRFEMAQAACRRFPNVRVVADDGMMHGVGIDQVVLLAEQSDRGVAAVRHAAVVGLQHASEHAQQRRLAVAVFTDDANAVTLVHAKRHAIENMLGGKL